MLSFFPLGKPRTGYFRGCKRENNLCSATSYSRVDPNPAGNTGMRMGLGPSVWQHTEPSILV